MGLQRHGESVACVKGRRCSACSRMICMERTLPNQQPPRQASSHAASLTIYRPTDRHDRCYEHIQLARGHSDLLGNGSSISLCRAECCYTSQTYSTHQIRTFTLVAVTSACDPSTIFPALSAKGRERHRYCTETEAC
jgi:hypothetical protein